MPELKRVKKAYNAGKKIAQNPDKYFSCWDAAKVALDKKMIIDNRNNLESFLDGYNQFKSRG